MLWAGTSCVGLPDVVVRVDSHVWWVGWRGARRASVCTCVVCVYYYVCVCEPRAPRRISVQRFGFGMTNVSVCLSVRLAPSLREIVHCAGLLSRAGPTVAAKLVPSLRHAGAAPGT